MRILNIAYVAIALISFNAYATRTSISSSCFNNSCKVKACVNDRCLDFNGASEGQFLRNGALLRLIYPNRSQKVHYYSWTSKSWLTGRNLSAVCPECEQPVARRNRPSTTVRVDVEANIGGVRIQADNGRPTRVVRRSNRRQAISQKLIRDIQRACDSAFMFDDKDECVTMLITSKNPQQALDVLKVVDDEVIGSSSKMDMLKQSLRLGLPTSKVSACMRNMSFDSGKKSCLRLVRPLHQLHVDRCLTRGGFDSDKIQCLEIYSERL